MYEHMQLIAPLQARRMGYAPPLSATAVQRASANMPVRRPSLSATTADAIRLRWAAPPLRAARNSL